MRYGVCGSLAAGAALVGLVAAWAGCSTEVAQGGALTDAGPGAGPDADIGDQPQGLRAEFFRHHGQLAHERIDAQVDFEWAGAPVGEVDPDHFSVRWSGWLDVPAAGTYTFLTDNDDGVRVWVDDQLVIDDWVMHSIKHNEGTVDLPAGFVPIRVDYFDFTSTAKIHLSWSSDDIPAEIIPRENLRALPAPSGLAAPRPPYRNPTTSYACPDPSVISVSPAEFYMVCTGGTFPIHRSSELLFWDDTGSSILPDGQAPWATDGSRNWAPEIHQVGTRFVAYFAALDKQTGKMAVGAAFAADALGPYTDRGGPLVQAPESGAIDPSFFRDVNGRQYLIYKLNSPGTDQPATLMARELTPDGLSFADGSQPVQLLASNPSTWEGTVIEAPYVVHHGDYYYLLYGGNAADYRNRIGAARATSVLGPYQKRGNPILANNATWVGPGQPSVVTVNDTEYLVYHAWRATTDGKNNTTIGREMLLDPIVWGDDGWPIVSDGSPSTTPVTWPGGDPAAP